MLFAKVVLGIPVEGPFDYIVPSNLAGKIKAGSRVWVSFGNKEALGYIVGLEKKSNVKNLKSILALIDEKPLLDKNMLSLTKELSEYYCCSWGEAIETAIPQSLRNKRRIPGFTEEAKRIDQEGSSEITLLHDLAGDARWEAYLNHIKETLALKRSAIILLPDVESVLKAKEKLAGCLNSQAAFLYRNQPREQEEWQKIKDGKVNLVAGTRSAIFAPLRNLGLVIIDEEENFVYKQDQVPHYHAREVALMRVNIEKAKLILGSTRPCLESFYSVKINRFKYLPLARKAGLPEVKFVAFFSSSKKQKQQKDFLCDYLFDSISATLEAKGKTLLFFNRKGFATTATCGHCGMILKCPRCNINLVYHFKENLLACHYCNFKMPAPNICPHCDRGYIRYTGGGIEKIESELARLFPQARIKKLGGGGQSLDLACADIFVSTQSIIRQENCKFDLVGVLAIDNTLGRTDFRASEKVFGLLTGLISLAGKKIIIQTRLSHHHCFRALEEKDCNVFYEEELRQRLQLNFPPYAHFGLVKLRGKKEDKVKEISSRLFSQLKNHHKNKGVAVLSLNPSQPEKLRGNFCWQILLRSKEAQKISKFLKTELKKFTHSGIIVTVDIDPI